MNVDLVYVCKKINYNKNSHYSEKKTEDRGQVSHLAFLNIKAKGGEGS